MNRKEGTILSQPNKLIHKEGRAVNILKSCLMGKKIDRLKTVLVDGVITLHAEGSENTPFTNSVEFLLGGVPPSVFPDGTQQFVDAADPVRLYSPRLAPNDLEAFCKAYIDRYEAFHGEDSAELDLPPACSLGSD